MTFPIRTLPGGDSPLIAFVAGGADVRAARRRAAPRSGFIGRIIMSMSAVALLLSGCAPSRPADTVLFPEWRPSLDQPIRQIEEILDELWQQQPLNHTISNLSFLYDAKLFILFHDYIALLPAAARVQAVDEQREWLAMRSAQVGEAHAEYEGGTLAPYNAGHAAVAATKERIAEIETTMARLRDNSR